jgi:hypothetical protein
MLKGLPRPDPGWYPFSRQNRAFRSKPVGERPNIRSDTYLIDDVVAAVDIHRFAGDEFCRVMGEDDCGGEPSEAKG